VTAVRRAAIVAVLALLVPAAPGMADPLDGGQLLQDVQHYAALGPVNHLTGSASDQATQDWMREQLAAAGLQTGIDSYDYYGFVVRQVALRADGADYANIAPYLYSGVTGASPVTAPMVYGGVLGDQAETQNASLAGKVVVIDVPYVKGAVDSSFANAFTRIHAAGAAALIAVTEGPQDYAVNQDVDSRAGVQGLPTVFVGKVSGQTIIAAAKAGKTASVLLDADVGERCTTNSWGVLPGADPSRFVIVGTPTGAFTPSGSERGPGVAELLGLARHYASLPVAQRPLTLVFAILSGHEIGYLGLPTFMATHAGWFAHADAYVHLGASLAAAEQEELPDGSVQRLPFGDPSRWLYASENPLLQPGVQKAFAAAGLLSVPPGALDPGEQGYAYHAGIPIVASSGGSYYFHTAGDTADGVDAGLLAQTAQGFAGSIDHVMSLPAGELRSANAAAAQAGAARDPNPTPSGGAGGDHNPVEVSSCV